MDFIKAVVVWLVMGAALGGSILWTVAGVPWLLVGLMITFIIAVGWIGCSTH